MFNLSQCHLSILIIHRQEGCQERNFTFKSPREKVFFTFIIREKVFPDIMTEKAREASKRGLDTAASAAEGPLAI